MPDLGPLFEQIRHLLEQVAPGIATLKGAQWLFKFREGDIPVCHTRITYAGKGIPLLDKRVTVHPIAPGVVEIQLLEPTTHSPQPSAKVPDPQK